jgi:O-antigen/teichoic acid export membrane protein
MTGTYAVVRLRRAVLYFAGGRLVQVLARAALVLLVVRLLPIEDYGAYMLVVGIAEMMLQLGSLGLMSVGQRFLPEIVDKAGRRQVKRFVWLLTAGQLAVLSLLCMAAWHFWDVLLPYLGFSADQIERSRPAVLLFLLIPAMRFTATLLEALLEQAKAQIARALMPIGRIGAVLALLAAGVEVTLERVLWVEITVSAGCLALVWILMRLSLARLAEPAHPEPLPVAAMARQAWHMATVEIMTSAQAPGALRMALANALGIAESGLFAFLQSLQHLVGRYLPGALLRSLARPMLISRVRSHNGPELLANGITLLLKSSLLVIAAAAMMVFVGGDRIVMMASGGKFPGAGDTLLLMILGLALISQRQMLEMLMQILNRTGTLRTTSLLAPVALAAVWYGASGGLNVAVLVWAAGIAAINSINLWRLQVVAGRYRISWWGMGSIILPAVAAALLGDQLLDSLGTWVALAVSCAALIALLFAVKPFAAGELRIAHRGAGTLAGRVMRPFTRMPAS